MCTVIDNSRLRVGKNLQVNRLCNMTNKIPLSNIGFLQNKMQRTASKINSSTLKSNIIWHAQLQTINDFDKE